MREKKLVLWSLGFLRLILLRGLFFETAETRYATKRLIILYNLPYLPRGCF